METMVKDLVKDDEQKMERVNPEKREGKVARTLEEQTAKIPIGCMVMDRSGLHCSITGFKSHEKG